MSQTTLIGLQEDAVAAILALPQQGPRSANYKLTLLNRKARGLSALASRYKNAARLCGFKDPQIAVQWEDVKDMARLEESAE